MRRREFIAGLGGAAAWPVAARAQQPAMPVIGFVNLGAADALAGQAAAFRKGLSETGYVEGQNVTVEYHWLVGQYDRLPAVMAELVRRRVAVIATPGNTVGAIAAKAATATIPIVFGVAEDPVKLGLVASLARPGGNATGINFFAGEVVAKRLSLLHELVPKAVRVAVLVNPTDGPIAETTLRDAQEAARAMGMQIHVLNANTIGEIDAAFATLAREHSDALFVGGGGFLSSRRVQIATLAARDRIPAAYSTRDAVAAGGRDPPLQADDLGDEPIMARQGDAARVEQRQHVPEQVGLRLLADFVADALPAERFLHELAAVVIANNLQTS
jgi:putative tryptophan/tyrosine transport system substrate-binding protein